MKRIRIVLQPLLILLLFSFTACKDNTKQPNAIFPLKEGNSWNYQGKYNEWEVKLQIKVLLVKKEGNLAFALMKGFCTDPLEGEEWESSVWALLVVGNEYYYKVSGSRIDSINKCLLNNESVHSGLVTDADLFMVALSDTGRIFGEAAQLTRNDGNYYWKVSEKHAYEPSSIKSLNIKGTFDRFTLTFKAIDSDVTMDIVPGIGIVRYRYCHHGTPEELDMKLSDAVIL